MSPLRQNGTGRSPGASFVCRYVERTLGQLGEEALDLSLVSRHLTECPACRAHRRRILKVDSALRGDLLGETPPWIPLRWERIASRIGGPFEIPHIPSSRSHRRTGVYAILSVMLLLMGAWWTDMRPAPAGSSAEVAPGITVTGASTNGTRASVLAEPFDEEDGTVYLWIQPEQPAAGAGIGPE